DDGHVEAVIYRLVHENAVEHAPRVHAETKRNVADAEDGLHLGQLLLDAAYRFQRLSAGSAVLHLACGDWQRQSVKDQVNRTNAVFLRRQLINTLGDCDFLVGGERHSFFVDGERNHRRPIALGHWQDLGSALLAIFQVDGVDDGLARNTLQAYFD